MGIFGNIDMEQSGQKMKWMLTGAGYDVKTIQNYLRLSCPQPVYRWFKGQMLPTVDHLFMLSRLLGIHMEDLLVAKGAPEPAGYCFVGDGLVLEHTGSDTIWERMFHYYKYLAGKSR